MRRTQRVLRHIGERGYGVRAAEHTLSEADAVASPVRPFFGSTIGHAAPPPVAFAATVTKKSDGVEVLVRRRVANE